MDKDAASALLGLSEDRSLEAIEAAYRARHEGASQRLATAPTDSLRQKYSQMLQQLDGARQVLLSSRAAGAGGLSRTQIADLPGAAPLYTRMGSGGASAAREAQQLQPGEVLANRYEVRACIGMGGMGAVYRAFDRNRSEEIAIKVLLPHLLSHPQARERLVAEAKLSSSLSHPNIVNVFDVQRDGEHDFLTMELLQGQTLRNLMQARKAARKPFTPAEALDIARSIGAALDYAHKRTVHRDLKPENVWVEEDGTFKLMDFGIARVMSNSQLTQTTTAMGTAYYMAPEQLRGAKDIDGRADQYALAVLLYEMLSGDIPAGRMRSLHLVNAEVSRSMSLAIDRALDAQREVRFASLGEFVAAMSARGSLFGAIGTRRLAAGLAVVMVLGAAAAFWPQVSKWLPDPAHARQQRNGAIQSQGVIETQLKRLEILEREQDARVRDAGSKVDRYENALRMARSEKDREEPAQQLAAASAQLVLETEVRDEAVRLAFRSDALARARGQLAVGAAALKDNQPQQAAEVLGATQAVLDKLAKLPDSIRASVMARGQFDVVLDNLERLGRDEKRDVASAVSAARAQGERAKAAAIAGETEQATVLYRSASTQAAQVLGALVDSLVLSYSKYAEQATQAGKFDYAQLALDRARKIKALKSDAK